MCNANITANNTRNMKNQKQGNKIKREKDDDDDIVVDVIEMIKSR